MLEDQNLNNVAALAKKCKDLIKGCVEGTINVEDFVNKL